MFSTRRRPVIGSAVLLRYKEGEPVFHVEDIDYSLSRRDGRGNLLFPDAQVPCGSANHVFSEHVGSIQLHETYVKTI